MPRFQILPAEEGFYDWFEKATENLVRAAELLVDMLKNFDNIQQRTQQLTEAEHKGDFIVHEIFDLLHKTFITPLDRPEIQSLATTLDDVLDYIESAADSMLLYKIEQPTPDAIRLGEIVLECARQINTAMPLLRHKRTISQVRQYMIEVNRLENEADRVTRSAMAKLLERPDQVFELIRWKEIYAQLEEATDRCEDVADVLNGVVLQNG